MSDTTMAPPTDQLAATLEAVLLACDKPLSAGKIGEALNLEEEEVAQLSDLIAGLNEQYEDTGRSFRIESVAGGYRMLTLERFAPAVAAVRGLRSEKSLSRAALETLAIVAYRQPVTRAQLEAIRGASSGELLRSLLERKLVRITGRAEELGRPMLYGTTKQFLEAFGLATIQDLPPIGDLFPQITPGHANDPNEPAEETQETNS
ncbi:MAG: SMC-Scp complex subunit ScpB [Planctomycetota bacterium]